MPPKFSEQISFKYISNGSLTGPNRTSPCENVCPAGNPIQKIHTLLTDKKPEEAYEYILARNPLPGITSRVCPHPCEEICNRNNLDENIAIKKIERYVSDSSDKEKVRYPKRAKSTGKHVAIVGSGPAGLTAAYYLSILGHQATIFEAENQIGGIPSLLIPEFKLNTATVQHEIKKILAVGVEIKLNTKVGKDILLEDLKHHHDAIIIASGAWQERKLNIDGEDACIYALDFLKRTKNGSFKDIGKNIIIIGGGGVAFDCALVAKKQGASQVKIICAEDEECLCAYPEDIAVARKEKIEVLGSKRVNKIVLDHSKIAGIETIGVKSFDFDDTGCALITPENDEIEKISGDFVIIAIGQIPGIKRLLGGEKLKINNNSTIWINSQTGMTSVPGIFATGDVTLGPSSVAASIGHGRQTALYVDRHLMDRVKDEYTLFIESDATIGCGHEIQAKNLETHVVTFDEIMNIDYYLDAKDTSELNKGQDDVISHAMKCMHCGQCRTCWSCIEDCPGLILAKGNEGPVVEYPDECWHCGCCRIACPSGAVSYQFPLRMLL